MVASPAAGASCFLDGRGKNPVRRRSSFLAPPVDDVRPVLGPTMATYLQGPPAAWSGYGYGDVYGTDIDALLRDIDTRADQPKPFVDYFDFELEAVLRGIRSVRVPAAGFAPFSIYDAFPKTPVAVLAAPCSYGDDPADSAAVIQTPLPPKNLPEPSHAYDASIDTTFRATEKDPAERPSAHYLWTVQAGRITMATRAHVVAWMYNFSGCYALAPGMLHRAVAYVDRFLSARKIEGTSDQLLILGAVAVFTAAKYEDRSATLVLSADIIAGHIGCTRHDVVDAERVLFAALGYRLGCPTAHTFVDHFTRHIHQEEGTDGLLLRTLAHHLANMTLLDYRCVRFLPSVVASSAIALARMTMDSAASWSKDIEVAGYTLEDLAGCMGVIYDMHKHPEAWPGCSWMMENFLLTYVLPPSR